LFVVRADLQKKLQLLNIQEIFKKRKKKKRRKKREKKY